MDTNHRVGYTDCHCHILPEVDDGAPDWDTSLAMARCAVDEGMRRMIATPHWPGDGRSDAATIRERCREATERFHAAGLDLTILPGHECVAEPDLLDHLKAGNALALADSPYVLVESPYSPLPFYFHDLMFRLQSAGFRPILAHPERNPTVQQKLETVTEMRQLGVAIQINTGSLLGEFGGKARSAALGLLKKGEVDLLSTDSHSAGSRAPVFSRALEVAGRLVDVEALVTTNPDLLIQGKPLHSAAPRASGGFLSRLFGR
jgi:protein-tyrosine phosphatase